MIITTAYPISGSAVYAPYGWESTFNSASASLTKNFGQGLKIATYDIDNDAEFLYALGSQDMAIGFAKTFKGTWGAEFILSDPWFLRAILGGAPTDGGSAPYTHTWTVANGGIANTLPSMTIDINMDMDTDSRQKVTGCVCNAMTLTCSVGDPVRVKLDGWFAGITKSSTLSGAPVSPVEVPMTFANGTLELPNSSTIANVQSVELSWNRNADAIYALGSRFPQVACAKNREWSIRCTQVYQADADLMDKVLGGSSGPVANPAEIATATLTITNGLSTSSTRSYAFVFANVFVSRLSAPMAVEDVIKQDVELRARSVTSVTVSNNTAVSL